MKSSNQILFIKSMIKGEGGVTIKTDTSADENAAKNAAAASIIVPTIPAQVGSIFFSNVFHIKGA